MGSLRIREWAIVWTDVAQVDEGLEQAVVLEVPVPELRVARVHLSSKGSPHVRVAKLGPETQVGIGNVQDGRLQWEAHEDVSGLERPVFRHEAVVEGLL